MPAGTSEPSDDTYTEQLLGARPQLGDMAALKERLRARLVSVNLDESIEETLPTYRLSRTIGRYEVLELLGRGGMGVVFRARDVTLDRELAIKLIREHTGPTIADDRARFHREARAMARLTHPNVVTIHEVGEHEGALYIAMELVEGVSLMRWLVTARRDWRSILDAIIAAGEGLAAAHAAGVIHRDFKPENVLVGDDGRVRVADFGLAWTGDAARADNEETLRVLEQKIDSETRRAHASACFGTPAYMAPEHYHGGAPSRAADQFSFSVTLYRALYGHLPFDASSPTRYQALAVQGTIRPAPRGSRVPRWLRAAIVRGLSASPEDRWPSLEALLQALRRGPRSRRWIPALLLALAGGVAVSGSDDRASCKALDEALVGVWDDEAQEHLRSRVLSASSPDTASRTWSTLHRLLELHVNRWSRSYSRVCSPSALDVPPTSAQRTARLSCLQAGLVHFEELGRLLARDGAPFDLEYAALAVTGLPAPELCLQVSTAPQHELDPRDLERALASRRRLARVSSFVELHRIGEARRAIDELLRIAREIDDDSLEAETRLALGRALRANGEPAAARMSLERARALVHEHAEHRALEMRIIVQLVDVVGVGHRALRDAELLAEEASVLARELGHPPLLEAYLANNLARVHRAHRRYEDANEGYLRAYSLLQQALGERASETIAVRVNLGVVQSRLGRPEAVAILEHALEQHIDVLGEYHPRTPAILRNLGNTLGRRGAYARAEQTLRRAAELRERLHDGPTQKLAKDLLALAQALRAQSRLNEAENTLTRAFVVSERAGVEASGAMLEERRVLDRLLASQ